MKKILITGASGFVGRHLIELLESKKEYELFGTKLKSETNENSFAKLYDLDLTNEEQVDKVIKDICPDLVFHLAAQSSVKKSWEDPKSTINTNVNGTINLLNSIKNHALKCRVLLVGSSEEYGATFETDSSPSESAKCEPQNIYAITKTTQNAIGVLYSKAFGMNIIMTRSFNHFGPGQSTTFVISDFCNQISRIDLGLQEPIISVGNLNAMRDFSDVRDIVEAYYMIILNGRSGDTYNVGSGKSITIKEILDKILSISSSEAKVVVDESKYRPIEIKEVKANLNKIKQELNWTPKYKMEDTIKLTLDYWKKQNQNKL